MMIMLLYDDVYDVMIMLLYDECIRCDEYDINDDQKLIDDLMKYYTKNYYYKLMMFKLLNIIVELYA